jgi:hypothetical protein
MAAELLCTAGDIIDVWPGFASLASTRQTSLIARASQRVLDYCRRPGFLEAEQTETFSGRNTTRLWLHRLPIVSIESVTIGGTEVDNTSGDAYGFDPGLGELWRNSGWSLWPSGTGNIVVAYTGGYSAVPDPVVEATCWLAKWMQESGSASTVYTSERIGDYSRTFGQQSGGSANSQMPSHIAGMLEPYVLDEGPL